MPRQVNKTRLINDVVGLPSQLYDTADRLATISNPRLSEVVTLLNKMQSVFDRIKPLLPPSNGIAAADWDAVATSRDWVLPTGGVVSAILTAAAAGQSLAREYATRFQPAVAPRMFALDQATGQIADPRGLVLTTDDMDLIRSQVAAFRDALEPITEI